MAKYEKNPDDEGKYQCPICEYGHGAGNGKSRQSVTKHYNALHLEETENEPIIPKVENIESQRVDVNDEEIEEFDDTTPSVPDWLTFDVSEELDESVTVELNPSMNSILRGMASGAEPPSSPKAMKEFYVQQGKMMRWMFAGFVDPLVSWYGRSVTMDAEFEIRRSSSDWTLFEEVSANWLEYHGLRLPVTPDVIMLGTVASFYLPVLGQIRKKRDPNRPSFIKKWWTRRKLRRKLKKEAERAQ